MPTLNLHQAQTLLEMFDGEDSLVTVEESATGHSGPGIYAHFEEYPDEGSVFLAPEPDPIEDDHPRTLQDDLDDADMPGGFPYPD